MRLSSLAPGARGKSASYLQTGCDVKRLPRQPAAGLLPCDGPTDAPVPAGLHPLLGPRFGVWCCKRHLIYFKRIKQLRIKLNNPLSLFLCCVLSCGSGISASGEALSMSRQDRGRPLHITGQSAAGSFTWSDFELLPAFWSLYSRCLPLWSLSFISWWQTLVCGRNSYHWRVDSQQATTHHL